MDVANSMIPLLNWRRYPPAESAAVQFKLFKAYILFLTDGPLKPIFEITPPKFGP